MQTGKLFVRDRNARAIFCIGFFAAQHPVKDVLPCTENRLIVHRIGDNGSLTVKVAVFHKEILGASPYWRSDVMKNEFKKVSSPQERHDYVVYKMHEDILNQRYHESVQTVLAELKKVIPRIELTGQWSVDVMRNGNDYYIIDMALAENSALNDCVPSNRLRAYPQQWLPGESNS